MAEQLSNYTCPNWGGPLQWDAESQRLKCEYCDSLFPDLHADNIPEPGNNRADCQQRQNQAPVKLA